MTQLSSLLPFSISDLTWSKCTSHHEGNGCFFRDVHQRSFQAKVVICRQARSSQICVDSNCHCDSNPAAIAIDQCFDSTTGWPWPTLIITSCSRNKEGPYRSSYTMLIPSTKDPWHSYVQLQDLADKKGKTGEGSSSKEDDTEAAAPAGKWTHQGTLWVVWTFNSYVHSWLQIAFGHLVQGPRTCSLGQVQTFVAKACTQLDIWQLWSVESCSLMNVTMAYAEPALLLVGCFARSLNAGTSNQQHVAATCCWYIHPFTSSNLPTS